MVDRFEDQGQTSRLAKNAQSLFFILNSGGHMDNKSCQEMRRCITVLESVVGKERINEYSKATARFIPVPKIASGKVINFAYNSDAMGLGRYDDTGKVFLDALLGLTIDMAEGPFGRVGFRFNLKQKTIEIDQIQSGTGITKLVDEQHIDISEPLRKQFFSLYKRDTPNMGSFSPENYFLVGRILTKIASILGYTISVRRPEANAYKDKSGFSGKQYTDAVLMLRSLGWKELEASNQVFSILSAPEPAHKTA